MLGRKSVTPQIPTIEPGGGVRSVAFFCEGWCSCRPLRRSAGLQAVEKAPRAQLQSKAKEVQAATALGAASKRGLDLHMQKVLEKAGEKKPRVKATRLERDKVCLGSVARFRNLQPSSYHATTVMHTMGRCSGSPRRC